MDEPSRSGSARDAAAQLLDLIMRGEYRLDGVVTQNEVATRLRVAHPTAIGAIAILSWLGVLSQEPFEPARVAPVAPDYLGILTRNVQLAVREAATRHLATQTMVEMVVDATKLPTTVTSCLEAEFAFLGQIVARTDDPWLVNMYSTAGVPLQRLLLQLRLALSGRKMLRDHLAIVTAVNRGGWQPAKSAIQDHFLGLAGLESPGVNLRRADYIEDLFQWPQA